MDWDLPTYLIERLSCVSLRSIGVCVGALGRRGFVDAALVTPPQHQVFFEGETFDIERVETSVMLAPLRAW
eukprot:COSAG01_NODE_423_length_17260_cov_203.736962_4_plen_71_part_00